ncbi:hypothetical protein Tco_1100997 [Tanacetum coccineum]
MGTHRIAKVAFSPCDVGLSWEGDVFVCGCRGQRVKGKLAALASEVVYRDGNGSGNFGDRSYHPHPRFSASSPSSSPSPSPVNSGIPQSIQV